MILLPLYIDPGTGSMLFSIFIGIATALSFGLRALYLKLKFVFSGGTTDLKRNEKSIPFVIFSDHKRYWNVFKPICDEFENRKIPVVFYTASSDDPALLEKYDYVKTEYLGEKNKPYARLNFLHADVLLATTPGLGVYQWKRSQNVKCYVHIPHSVCDFAGYRMFALDHYDSVIASGENQLSSMRKLEKLRPTIKQKEFIIAGSTYLDAMKQRLDSIPKNSINTRKVVLVAPTWGKSSILAKFGEKFLSALEKTPFDIVIRPHPQSVISDRHILLPLQKKFSSFTWNFDNDNFNILNKADIMITDFSGVMFDYSLVFDKPLIYTDTNFDSLPYDADWLDEPMWEFSILKKLGVQLKEEQFDEIEQVIEKTILSDELKKSRKEVRNESWQNIGKAADSTVNFLIKKQEILKNRN